MRKEEGLTLILILWIIAILSITTLSLASYMRLQLRITKNKTERLKAYYIARAGIERAILELRRDTNDYDALNEEWSTNEEAYNSIQFGEGEYSIQVIDEESKLNINIPVQDEEDKILFSRLLLSLPEIREDQVSAILEHRREGGIFRSVDEISTLKKIDQEVFLAIKDLITVYSSKESNNKKINLNKATIEELKSNLGLAHKEADEIIRHRPYRYLTDLIEFDWMSKDRFIKIVDRITLLDEDIVGRININTTSEYLLSGLGFDQESIEFIIRERRKTPFRSISQLLSTCGIDLKGLKGLNLDLVTFNSHSFSIDSVAVVDGTLARIEAVLRREAGRIFILYWREV